MTTTTNLGVTKIDVGQAQKEVTANEAFDVFDAALSELAHVMSDADYTLLTATVPQEWQYGILSFTGALTAARNVIAPLNRKEYTVVNGTTGGFALTFKTSAGTGIAVAAGASAILRCDGTNIVEVTTGAAAVLAAHVAAADPHTQYVLESAAQPFDIHASYQGVPPASIKVLPRVPVARAVAFVANFAGSYGKASAAATAITAFDVQKNGVSIGTITFAAAATTATFATAAGAAQSLAAGDVLAIIAPATPDATLADPGFVLAGTR